MGLPFHQPTRGDLRAKKKQSPAAGNRHTVHKIRQLLIMSLLSGCHHTETIPHCNQK